MLGTVVISSNGHHDYEPLVPLAVRAWERLGWSCDVLRPDDGLASTAQIMRLFGAVDKPDDELVMLSDADLLPLSAEVFQGLARHKIFCYGWDLVPAGQVPICYTGAKAVYWRRFMQYERWPGVTLSDRARAMFAWFKQEWPEADPWYADQIVLARCLRRVPVAFLRRDTGVDSEGYLYPTGRYDRGNGLADNRPGIDMHCRPNSMARIKQVLEEYGVD